MLIFSRMVAALVLRSLREEQTFTGHNYLVKQYLQKVMQLFPPYTQDLSGTFIK